MGLRLDKLFEAAVVAQLDLQAPLAVPSGTSVGEATAKMREGKRGALVVTTEGRVAGIFTEVDFARKVLGRDLPVGAKIDDTMTRSPRTVTRATKLSEAFELMSRGNFRHLPVVDDGGKPVQMLAVRHLVQYLAERFPAEILALPPQVHQAMTAVDGG